MADVVDALTRSRMMAGIRSKDTKPELLIRSLLHRRGFRFRLHVRDLPGRPDIVLPRYRAVIFVHGCFWHGHDCRLFKLPGTRTQFWQEKIERNRSNDANAKDSLLVQNWRVCLVWECAIYGADKNTDAIAARLSEWIRSDAPYIEVKG